LSVESNPTDGEAIRASLARPEAFEPVFDRHYDSIYRYLARRVGPDTGAELTSEVFTIAFARRHSFHSDAQDAGPWLYGIAANLARRQARTWRRRRRANQRSVGGTVIWLDPSPEDRIDAENMRAVLLAAISELRSNEREVLLLHALTDLTYREVAEALAIPIGTVRSRLARARRQVRESLIQAGHPDLAKQIKGEDDSDAR
jgi:RNA polymerase sigma-70 factor (ECF subfamily)